MNVDKQRWVKVLKDLKEKQVLTGTPAIPSTVVLEKENKVWVVATAPHANRDEGLQAAFILKSAIDPDLVVTIFDAHFKEVKEESLVSESKKSLGDQYKKGNNNVKEALFCILINKDKEISMLTLPYYHGGDNILIWGEEIIMKGGEGYIVDALTRIMKQPLLIDSPIMRRVAKDLGMDRDKQIYHGAMGAVQALRADGYTVIDYFSKQEDIE